MAVSNVTLTPISELAPGQVSAIRNSIITAVVDKAATEQSLPRNKLVVRDIRAYTDLGFGNNTDYMATATSTDVWGTFESTDTYIVDGTGGAYRDAIADNTTMADQRYVCIYGVRDMRCAIEGAAPHIAIQDASLIKFDIGNADRVIWDISKIECYRYSPVGITPTAVVIPPLAPYQISVFLIAGGDEIYLQLMGFVVEPVGLLITP